jgi:peptidoglycan/LPS O-acetylase OafA/YrhL
MHKRGEIASLTGLRGLAALLVVIAHYWPWTAVTKLGELPIWMTPWIETSAIGMAIFFTLSGYVIALSYGHWDWHQRPGFNAIRLVLYRFARLYPAFFVFAIIVVLKWPDLQDFGDPDAVDYLVPHFLLVQSWWPMKFGGDLAAEDHFHVSWSLSVECALYVAFALGAIGAAVLPRRLARSLLLAAALLIGGKLLLDAGWNLRGHLMPAGWSDSDWVLWLYFFSPCGPLLQFGLGVAACAFSRRQIVRRYAKAASMLGGLGLIAVYVYFAVWPPGNRFDQTMTASLATAFILIGSQADSITNRLLSGRVIIYVGTISYSLYLFHFLAPSIAHVRSFDAYTPTAALFHASHFAASFALAILLATGVYRLVEVPGRRFLRAMADKLLGIERRPVMQGAPAE